MAVKTPTKKKRPLTDGERSVRLPEGLVEEIVQECTGRGATSKTSLVVELLWETIRNRKKVGQWHTESL